LHKEVNHIKGCFRNFIQTGEDRLRKGAFTIGARGGAGFYDGPFSAALDQAGQKRRAAAAYLQHMQLVRRRKERAERIEPCRNKFVLHGGSAVDACRIKIRVVIHVRFGMLAVDHAAVCAAYISNRAG